MQTLNPDTPYFSQTIDLTELSTLSTHYIVLFIQNDIKELETEVIQGYSASYFTETPSLVTISIQFFEGWDIEHYKENPKLNLTAHVHHLQPEDTINSLSQQLHKNPVFLSQINALPEYRGESDHRPIMSMYPGIEVLYLTREVAFSFQLQFIDYFRMPIHGLKVQCRYDNKIREGTTNTQGIWPITLVAYAVDSMVLVEVKIGNHWEPIGEFQIGLGKGHIIFRSGSVQLPPLETEFHPHEYVFNPIDPPWIMLDLPEKKNVIKFIQPDHPISYRQTQSKEGIPVTQLLLNRPFLPLQIDDLPQVMEKMNWLISARLLKRWLEKPAWTLTALDESTLQYLPDEHTEENILKMRTLLKIRNFKRDYHLFIENWLKKTATHKMKENWRYLRGTTGGTGSPAIDRLKWHLGRMADQGQETVKSHLGPQDLLGFSEISPMILDRTCQVASQSLNLTHELIEEIYGQWNTLALRLAVVGHVDSRDSRYFKIEKIGIYLRGIFHFNEERFLGVWNARQCLSQGQDNLTWNPPTIDALQNPADYRFNQIVTSSMFRKWRNQHQKGGDFVFYSDIKWEDPPKDQEKIRIE